MNGGQDLVSSVTSDLQLGDIEFHRFRYLVLSNAWEGTGSVSERANAWSDADIARFTPNVLFAVLETNSPPGGFLSSRYLLPEGFSFPGCRE